MSEPLTPEEEAEIRKMDATFEADNPNDYARPDWLVGLLHERRRLLATLDAARAAPVHDERQVGLAERVRALPTFALVDAPGLDFVLAEDVLALLSTEESRTDDDERHERLVASGRMTCEDMRHDHD